MYTDPSLSGASAKLKEKKKSFLFRGKVRFRRYIQTSCAICHKDIFSVKENNSKNRICSQKCKNILMSGPGNPKFKGRKFKDGARSQGHVLSYAPNHPHQYKKFVPEHRLVIEKALNRILKKTEVVHHINCVKFDNSIENLVVCASISEHNKVHASLNKIIKTLLDKKYIRFNRKKMQYDVIK